MNAPGEIKLLFGSVTFGGTGMITAHDYACDHKHQGPDCLYPF